MIYKLECPFNIKAESSPDRQWKVKHWIKPKKESIRKS